MAAQAPDNTLAFSAATIRPSQPNNPNSNFNISTDRITTENLDVASLIKFAYNFNRGSNDQIINAPAWVHTSAFDINAIEDESTIAALSKMTQQDRERAIQLMLQSFLADRFHLKLHHETRQLSVIALLVAPGGPKLKSPADAPGWKGIHNDGQGHIEGRDIGLVGLADVLGVQPEIDGRMVVDQTGLTGLYDFTLNWSPQQLGGNDTSSADSAGPGLFAALPEQLGLKLKSIKAPIDVIVIDHIDLPTPN